MDCALDAVRARVSENGKPDASRIESEQHAVHGLAWLATYVEAIKEVAAYARRMNEEGRFGETEQLLTRIGLGEYLAQAFSAIPMNQSEMVRPSDFGLAPQDVASFRNEIIESLIAEGNTRENRAALAALIGEARRRRDRRSRSRRHLRGDPRRDAPLRRRRGRAPRARVASRQRLYPARGHRGLERNGRLRPHHPRGLWRHGARQGGDVRRLGGIVARLYRRRLARHPIRDRGRAHPGRRDRGAEAEIPAPDRQRRDSADRGVHRAQHRLRPRVPAHPRDPGRRRLRGQRGQDLDHPSRARRSDDAAGPHQPGRARLPGPVDVSGRETARDRRRAFPGQGHVGRPKSRCSAIAA